VGDRRDNHWFDGLAMLHKFAFASGRVAYANRYLRSQSYREAMPTGSISRGEFATDPCRTLFQRVAAWFSPKFTDNCNVSVNKLAGEVVAYTETRMPIRFDPDTLNTLGGYGDDERIKGPVSLVPTRTSTTPEVARTPTCWHSAGGASTASSASIRGRDERRSSPRFPPSDPRTYTRSG
jgi:carotenoid cleavage dioxygenase-like enzyme